MVVINRKSRPARKTKSAIRSYLLPITILLLMEIKESKLLTMNITMASVVSSSIIVRCVNFITLREVSTTKHIPSSVADVFSMCGDWSLLPGICFWVKLEPALFASYCKQQDCVNFHLCK